MLLDLLLISVLSYVPSFVVALVAAVATWIVSKRHEQVVSPWARRWLRVVSALVIFVSVASVVSQFTKPAESDVDGSLNRPSVETLARTGAVVLLAAKIEACENTACIDGNLPALQQQLDAIYANAPAERNALVGELLSELQFLTAEQQQHYRQQLLAPIEAVPQLSPRSPTVTSPSQADSASAKPPAITERSLANTAELSDTDANQAPSLIAWIKGIITDLGLGLSWGAAYFTLFTALGRGQTPGKKLLGIRVVRLNGEPLSLWAAFGRYGGYGAGIATGLLGFLQVYWDNNRQCIQDKIGETVVVQDAAIANRSAPAEPVSPLQDADAAVTPNSEVKPR
ncbi:RDD family protein [Shewanella avicenniae]|uniref:RDD family protein n=2 Tax=Shewanella avicenniae TaxID=2814294 RepID=A0ABX7QVK3_9GAMM|nr:RDD family protein [Shewanella avicenniae]